MNNTLKRLILLPLDGLFSFFPKLTTKLLFRIKVGYPLNLTFPKTYNEKINWIKFNYHNPDMSICSDKYLVRDYVIQAGCEGILNDLLWQGFSPDNIPFESLPDQFVIKTTHGSGQNIICKDKNSLDKKRSIGQMEKWLKSKYLKCYGEWWYGVHQPRIVVERFLENNDGSPLFDYKFFCFNGEPRYVYVDTWRDGSHHINMYDMEFKRLSDVKLGYPNDDSSLITKPGTFDRMVEISRVLSKGFPHVRVDLYSVDNEKVVFGEMTFSKGAGLDRIQPYDFDVEMGKYFLLKDDIAEKDR